jgi:hypothetical protein
MLRLSPLPRLALLALVPLLAVGCKTVYSDVYKPTRNHFVPPAPKKDIAAEKKALEELEKQSATQQPAVPTTPATGVPGLDTTTPPAGATPPAEMAPPAVPGAQ